MQKLGEILKETREKKHVPISKVAQTLHLKPDVIEAIEAGNWGYLPHHSYVKGFIKNYADFLGLDSNRLLALHRAEYDERQYNKDIPRKTRRRLMFTPNLLAPITFIIAILIFASYLFIQSTSILKAPTVEVTSPQDDITTTANVIEISGKAEKETALSINGEIVPLDESNNFNYLIKLEDGRNVIEIIGSKELSPKTKIIRVVRLSR